MTPVGAGPAAWRALQMGNVSLRGNSGLLRANDPRVLRTSDLDYELPPERVATHPAVPRDSARLLVVRRDDPAAIDHVAVADLPAFLRRHDVLVVNTSSVIPARLLGRRADTRGRAEGLWIGSDVPPPAGPGPGGGVPPVWRVLLKARRLKPGIRIDLDDAAGRPSGVGLRLLVRTGDAGEEGAWRCGVEGAPIDEPAMTTLHRLGHVPLPPYIRAARRRAHESDEQPDDQVHYQCVYADGAQPGSVAAPTAGLHFTPALLDRLAAMGVARAPVTLHVGTGTFKPVESEVVEDHPMHAEWCRLPPQTAAAIVAARAAGGRVVAVGTTGARTLESFGPAAGLCSAGAEGWSRLLITPGHAWQNVDALLTNFHLPRSTLLALVGAMLPEGVPRLLDLYRVAIDRGYRFYSYGDAMLIL